MDVQNGHNQIIEWKTIKPSKCKIVVVMVRRKSERYFTKIINVPYCQLSTSLMIGNSEGD